MKQHSRVTVFGLLLLWALAPGVSSASTFVNAAATTPIAVVASVSGQGIYRTSTIGGSWAASRDGDEVVNSVATGTSSNWQDIFASTPNRLYASHDSGLTWTTSYRGSSGLVVTVPYSSGVMLAATAQGLLRSNDEGRTWANVFPTVSAFTALTASAGPTPICYGALVNGHIVSSTDGGLHWLTLARRNVRNRFSVTSLAINPQNKQTLYAATTSGIWRSTGGHWTQLAVPAVLFKTLIANELGFFALSNNDNNLYVSLDGLTWTHQAVTAQLDPLTALAQDQNIGEGTTISVGDKNGTAMVSRDGGHSWIGQGTTVAGSVGNAITALALIQRPILPSDGVANPRLTGIDFDSAHSGHTVQRPFLTTYLADRDVLGAPATEQFTDTARGGISAQYFDNMELLVQNGAVVPAPLGLESRPAAYAKSTEFPVDPLFQQFWSTHGAAAFVGAAVTPLVNESNHDGTGQPYPTQYFHNARLEYHADLHQVFVSHLGLESMTALGWT